MAVFWQIQMSHCAKIGHKLNISPTRHPAPLQLWELKPRLFLPLRCSLSSAWKMLKSKLAPLLYPQEWFRILIAFVHLSLFDSDTRGRIFFLFHCDYVSALFAHMHSMDSQNGCACSKTCWDRTVCMAEKLGDIYNILDYSALWSDLCNCAVCMQNKGARQK